MRTRALTMARILTAAALAVLVATSCPNPIDDELLLVVDDDTAPLVTIVSPSQNSLYRYSVAVSGSLHDYSGATGSDEGFVRSLAFSVSGNPLLARTVTFARDGSFTVDPPDPTFACTPATGTFSFTVNTERLIGPTFFTFVVEDLNGNASQQIVILLQDPIGPKLTVTAPLNGSSWPLLLPVAGTAVNEAGAATGDRIAKITTSIAGESHQLDLQLLDLQADGKYYGTGDAANFWFTPASGGFYDSFDLSSASDDLQLMVEVEDARGMATTAFLSLFDNNTGPEIIMDDASHLCPNIYSSAQTTSITMLGWVDPANLKPGTTRYIVEPTVGVPRSETPIVVVMDPPPAPTGNFSFTFNPKEAPVLEGRLTVHVYAEDNAGRLTHGTHNIYDDPVKPSGTFTVASDATYANTTATSLTFTISDSSSGMREMQFSNDGGAWSAWEPFSGAAYAWALNAANGTRTVNAQFSDQAGNILTVSDTIILDTVPPNAPAVSGSSSPTTDTTPSWSWNTPNDTVQFRRSLDNPAGPWTTTAATSWTPSSGLGDGSHTLYVQGRDEAGNWSASGNDSVTIDTTPPPAPSVSGTATTTTLTWEWDTPGDATGFRRSLDGGSWNTTGANSWSAAFDPGDSHTLAVQARDALGNWSGSGSCTLQIVEE